MIAYKAFCGDLSARLGKEYQYEIDKIHRETEANCGRNGFHCCENPLDCFNYYRDTQGDRYFEVEISGDLDETWGDSAIAGTEIKILRELSLKGMVEAAIEYMLNYPDRDDIYRRGYISVMRDKAETNDGIAIARGKHPAVRGTEGSIIAMVKEDENGNIIGAWVEEVDGHRIEADRWYQLKE